MTPCQSFAWDHVLTHGDQLVQRQVVHSRSQLAPQGWQGRDGHHAILVLRQAHQGPQGFSSHAHHLPRHDRQNRIRPQVLFAQRTHLVVQFLKMIVLNYFMCFFSFWNIGLATICSTDNSTMFSPTLPLQTRYCGCFPQHYQQAHHFHQRGHTSDHVYRMTILPIFICSLIISFIPELQLSLFTFLFLWSLNITTFSPAMYLLSACHSSGYNIHSLATFILDTEHFPTSLHELFAGKTNFTSFYFTFPLTA